MTSEQLYRLPPGERVKAALASTKLGCSSKVEIIDKQITVAVPTSVCPGKLMADVAFLSGISDSEVPPQNEIPLSKAIELSPLGCKSITGGRATNLKFLQAVLQATVDRGGAEKFTVSVGNAS